MKLAHVWIPPSVRGFTSNADVFDVEIEGAVVSSIAPSESDESTLKIQPTHTLLPCFVDVHVHIDKTFVVEETGAADGDLHKAIDLMAQHRSRWTPTDIEGRMARALEAAYASGTRAMRTHLDWMDANAPQSLSVFERLQSAWRGRIALQCVSLTPLDVLADLAVGQTIAAHLARVHQGSDHASGEAALLGAFVYRNADLREKLQRVFALAIQHNLDFDFHVDEGLDSDACGLRLIAELTIQNNMQGRVTCGHACSLSVQSADEAQATLTLCAKAGIHLVALPSTNLYLQGAWDGTPVERGITRLMEAQKAGVSTSMATDNVADGFFPYGSYDLLETFGLGVQVAHLSPADAWLPSITSHPAAAMQLPWDGKIREGCPADLIVLNARSAFELISPQGRVRRVMRDGIFLNL